MLNPFKIVGSYIGLLAGVIGAYFSFAFIFYLAESGNFHFAVLFIPFLIIIAGFLLGWFIDWLIRTFYFKQV